MSQIPTLLTAKLHGSNLVVEILMENVRDAGVAYQLRDEIIKQIIELNPANVVIDLAKAKFIGSIGFLAFLGVRRQLADGLIVLCHLSEPIREMFAVSKLIASEANSAAPFVVATTRDAALARCQ